MREVELKMRHDSNGFLQKKNNVYMYTYDMYVHIKFIFFPQMSPNTCDLMYNYGKHLGLAFQVVDDILDFTQACLHFNIELFFGVFIQNQRQLSVCCNPGRN